MCAEQYMAYSGRRNPQAVLIISYETFRLHASILHRGTVGLVICDEVFTVVCYLLHKHTVLTDSNSFSARNNCHLKLLVTKGAANDYQTCFSCRCQLFVSNSVKSGAGGSWGGCWIWRFCWFVFKLFEWIMHDTMCERTYVMGPVQWQRKVIQIRVQIH